MSHILYNFTNICAVTWLERKEIKSITIKSPDHCLVNLKSGEVITVRANEVKEAIALNRKERTVDIEIIDNSDHSYTAFNAEKGTEYLLIPHDSYIFCNCNDYANQSIALNTTEVCCKHIWSLLGYLGFNDLAEYQDFKEEEHLDQLYQQHLEEQDYYHTCC